MCPLAVQKLRLAWRYPGRCFLNPLPPSIPDSLPSYKYVALVLHNNTRFVFAFVAAVSFWFFAALVVEGHGGCARRRARLR
ncbi:hypothetical protein Taro_016775 [Colocasia esculenta]|uniref:Uncharacterized protein n=1 Tax=Colocasia esculenta TaxID=4460 RepID=A0A843UEM7_COLES|nr:hypothetical protein [Colocasia esculenta]